MSGDDKEMEETLRHMMNDWTSGRREKEKEGESDRRAHGR